MDSEGAGTTMKLLTIYDVETMLGHSEDGSSTLCKVCGMDGIVWPHMQVVHGLIWRGDFGDIPDVDGWWKQKQRVLR